MTVSHFESSRAVALLARLTLYPRRLHPREELVELLWPEVDPEVARTRLRHTLRTLRVLLEAGLPAGSVLIADRHAIRVNPEAVATDVAEFEQAIARRDRDAARALYHGALLPGLWDDWIVEERYRLDALADGLAESAAAVSQELSSAAVDRRGPSLSTPPYLTAFFGREWERETIVELLQRARLVTLTGLGGTGKTRLSVEVVRQLAPQFEHAAFVSLGECVAASQIVGRIRDVFGLPSDSADPLRQICWKLGDGPALLVLDNLEHLIDSGGAALIENLLAQLPGLVCLVTSRRSLDIPGERLLPVEPLSEETSLALFLDRVQSTRPGFHVTAGNQDDLLAVCRGLEGIPLALELAAARIRAFSVAEMRHELQNRFDWLARTGLKGDKEDRHRSLAAALDWSWRLLSVPQRRFLAALSLFRSGWSAADAAAVTGDSDAREKLESLIAGSLVASAVDVSGKTRYAMLETVREFVAPRLLDAAEARKRFRHHYLTVLDRDENRTAAWESAIEDEDAGDAHAFAADPGDHWIPQIGVEKTRALLEATLALPCDDTAHRLRSSHRLAQCLLRSNERQEAIRWMDDAVAALESPPEDVLADALSCQAHIGLYDAPHDKTLPLLDRCLAMARDPYVRAEALRMKGCLLCWTPAYETAQVLFDEAETLYTPGSPGRRRLLIHRGHLARRRQRFDDALRLYRHCADEAHRVGDGMLHKTCQSNIADILTCQGCWQESIVTGLECLKVEEAYGDRHIMLNVLWNLARPLLETGEIERAAKLLAAAATLWQREVRPLSADEIEERDGILADLALRLDTDTLARLWANGEALRLDEAIALARL
jgi:predicted ATPase